MRIRTLLFALMIASPAAASAQQTQPEQAVTQETAKPTMQQQLMPDATAKLIAPVESKNVAENDAVQPMMQSRGSATGLMIAGAALFIAGLVVGGDAGTVVAIAGAAIGAYGLYLYF